MKAFFLFLFAAILVVAGEPNAELRTRSSVTDAIQITATAVRASDGRTLIKCVLTNKSNYILTSALPRTMSRCFRFSLIDDNGKFIPMNEQWALTYAQPTKLNGSILAERSWSELFVRPNQSSVFDFYLEEAFGENAKEGKILDVQWINLDPLQKGYSTIKIDEIVHSDGSVTPAYEEENHFPGTSIFQIKLPLTDDAVIEADKPSANVSSQDVVHPGKNTDGDTRKQNDKQQSASKTFDLRWLILLLIPALFLVLRIARAGRAS